MSSPASRPTERIARALPQVFMDASLPIIVEDLEGLVISTNPAAEEAYGWSNEELVGLPIKTLVPPSHHEQADELLSLCRSGELVRDVEGLRKRKDGKLIPVLLTLSLLTGENEQQFIASMATDISALKAAEERLLSYQDALEERVAERTSELRSALEELDRARLSADLANSAKSEFLANISHEIRTPMNAILGMTHLCLETELSPKQRGYLGKIERATLDLLGLVNDILDFSKIEAGKLELEEVVFSLDEILEKQRDLFALQAAKKDIELIFYVDSGVAPLYRGDPLRLGQILTNLLSNALKFTDHGQIELAVSTAPSGLRFSVTDTGIGVEEAVLESLFESFNQFDASTTRRYGGTGLGLAICRRLVEMMEGRIGASSRPGKGSEFWFEVPASGFADRRQVDIPSDKSAVVIDSHPYSRNVLVKLVAALGWRVRECSTVGFALEAMKNGSTPDVIIIGERQDLNLEALLKQRSGCPILQLTKFSAAREGAQRGNVLCLQRPVTRSLLLGKLTELLHRGNSAGVRQQNRVRLAERFSDLEGVRVLGVEDNFINREVLREMLANVEAEVVEAGAGEECLRLAEEQSFDVILMDIQMSGIDGVQTARRLRLRGEAAPILAVSANTAPWERRSFLEAGMNGFLAKPILPLELYTTIRKLRSQGVLDKELALRTLMGNEALYHQLVGRLFDDAQAALAVFQRGVSKEAIKQAHDLGSTALSLGMRRLGRAARSLEDALRREASYAGILEELREALLITIDSYECRRGDPVQQSLDVTDSAAQAPPAMAALREKLVRGEADAVEMTRSLVDSVADRSALAELLALVENFEFEKAADWLAKRFQL